MEKNNRYEMIGMIMHTLPSIEGRIGRTLVDKLVRVVDVENVSITRLQLLALFILLQCEYKDHRKVNMTMLAEWMHVSVQQATRLVDGLIKSGFATRTHDTSDRRIVWIRPTQEGAAYMKVMKEKALPVIDEAFADFDEEQMQKLVDAFLTIHEILSIKKEG